MNLRLSRSALFAASVVALVGAATPALSQQTQQQPRPPAPAAQPPRPPAAAQPAQPAQRPAAAPATAPRADTPLPPKGSYIVIIDLQAVEREGTAYVALRQQYDRLRSAMQADFAKAENDLRNSDQELARQRTVLSQDAYNDRRRALEKRIQDAQAEVQRRGRDLDQTFGAANDRIVTASIKAVNEIASENEYSVVLARQQVVMLNNALDITGEVIKRLNKAMPTITVTAPAR